MLINLCLNAKDAMPEGGHLSIGIERLLLEAGHPDLGRDMGRERTTASPFATAARE
jgi:hypothetical protein